MPLTAGRAVSATLPQFLSALPSGAGLRTSPRPRRLRVRCPSLAPSVLLPDIWSKWLDRARMSGSAFSLSAAPFLACIVAYLCPLPLVARRDLPRCTARRESIECGEVCAGVCGSVGSATTRLIVAILCGSTTDVRRPRLGGFRNLPPAAGARATAYHCSSLFNTLVADIAFTANGNVSTVIHTIQPFLRGARLRGPSRLFWVWFVARPRRSGWRRPPARRRGLPP